MSWLFTAQSNMQHYVNNADACSLSTFGKNAVSHW